ARRRGPRAAGRLPDARPDRLRRVARGGAAHARAGRGARASRARRRRPQDDRPRPVNVLGFDTSTAATSACLLRTDGQAFEVLPGPERVAGPPRHAQELMPALARVVDEAGVGWEGVEAVAVGVGPGTFTGLRIGVATARA